MIVRMGRFEPFAVKVQPDMGTGLNRSAGGADSRPDGQGICSNVGSATQCHEGDQSGERSAEQSPTDHGNGYANRGGTPVERSIIHRTP